MPAFIPRAEVERVFEEWRETRPNPKACKLTDERADLIRARLRAGYSAEDLCRIIRYINRADEDDPRWMRGQNPRRRKYLDLSHLFRKQRMGERSEASAEWEDRTGGSSEVGGVDADPFTIIDPGAA